MAEKLHTVKQPIWRPRTQNWWGNGCWNTQQNGEALLPAQSHNSSYRRYHRNHCCAMTREGPLGWKMDISHKHGSSVHVFVHHCANIAHCPQQLNEQSCSNSLKVERSREESLRPIPPHPVLNESPGASQFSIVNSPHKRNGAKHWNKRPIQKRRDAIPIYSFKSSQFPVVHLRASNGPWQNIGTIGRNPSDFVNRIPWRAFLSAMGMFEYNGNL